MIQEVYRTVTSPVGALTIGVMGESVTSLSFGASGCIGTIRDESAIERSVLDACAGQLAEYFAGSRRSFDLDLNPRGTAFQQLVWRELRLIPYATTINYGEQARRIGRPTAARAVGAANGRNPIAIIVPCHRVIGASGSLTGFAGGLDIKKFLLDIELSYGQVSA